MYDDSFAVEPLDIPEEQSRSIFLEEMIREQQKDCFCAEIRARPNGGVQIPFAVNDQGYVVRLVTLTPQVVVPHTPQQRVLHLSHYAKLTAHPGWMKLYLTLRRDLCWPAIAVDCYSARRSCSQCAKNNVKLRMYSKKSTLCPARVPPQYVAIYIFGELVTNKRRFRYLVVLMDHF